MENVKLPNNECAAEAETCVLCTLKHDWPESWTGSILLVKAWLVSRNEFYVAEEKNFRLNM